MTQPNDFFPESQDAMPAVRARVPDHVRLGVFSTGMIVMTGSTEFILDFVQNLGRPYQIVARVIVPHLVLPQFADALATNIELFKGRFGPLPNPRLPGQEGIRTEVVRPDGGSSAAAMPYADPHAPSSFASTSREEGSRPAGESEGSRGGGSVAGGGVITGTVPLGPTSGSEMKTGVEGSTSGAASMGHSGTGSQEGGPPSPALPPTASPPLSPPSSPPPPRRPTAQEVYDDLKLPDELLNGKYANAVMIGHGPNEFSFDFITNFYPQSAVSCRVFVGAGQASRILESLRTAWDQTRGRYYPPPPPPNQG